MGLRREKQRTVKCLFLSPFRFFVDQWQAFKQGKLVTYQENFLSFIFQFEYEFFFFRVKPSNFFKLCEMSIIALVRGPLRGKMETGICLFLHWESGIWVTGNGNHKNKTGNGKHV